MRKRLYSLSLCIFLTIGCAGVEISKITPENPYKEGLRFYRPYPYVWVTKDKDGDLQGIIVWLPDRSEEYVIRVKSGIGSVDSKFTLQDGWNLTGLNETRDSKTPEMINALRGSLKDLTGILKKAREEEFHPGLYMLLFDDQTGLINGLKPVVQFR